ncbi:uncharacterized protein, partial [Amphiura filiformis]|uniref:uncharacterized protein n=1 Tax=Amphiura filiformis TaxID=82378 RepID=UPI003B21C51C
IWHRLENLGRDWIGPFFCVVQIVNPEYIKVAVANADSKDNFVYNLIRPWLGDGLLTSEGSKWMRHRRLLTPAFHFEILRPYVGIFVESTRIFLNKLSETKGRSVDVFEHVSLMTLDSLLKCSFSYHSNCQLNEDNEYTNAVFTFSDLFTERFRFVPYHLNLIFQLSPSGFKWRRCLRVLHGKSEDAIRKRRQELKKLKEKGISVTKRGKYMDFLDILLQARDVNGEGMTDQEIREEVDTFMFEGHDTTSSGISWCLYNLGRFPEHQQKCFDEVQQLLQEKGKTELKWDDLNSLPFTTMFIKESLRFHAPVPGILRTLIKEVTFPDGTVLPKGTYVTVSPLATHHHPLYWENPEVFDPYRFLPERSKGRHSHAFIPFSAGPRNCIGQNFAMNELKVVVAMTVQRFQIAVDSDRVPEWTPRLVLRSLNGIHLKFLPRLNNKIILSMAAQLGTLWGANTLSILIQVTILLLIVKFCTTVYGLFTKRWYMQQVTANIDNAGLETSFIWGNIRCYPPPNTKGFLDKLLEVYLRHVNLGVDWLGPFICFVRVLNPEYIKVAVANSGSKDNLVYNFVRAWLGDGLLLSEGPHWMTHRRLLTPAFHFEILRPYVKIYVDSTNIFLDKLSETKGRSVDVFEHVSLMTLDSLLKCSFSYHSNCQLNPDNEYTNAVHRFGELFGERVQFVPHHFDFIFHLSPSGFKWRRSISVLHKTSEEAIMKRRKELKELEDEGNSISRRGKYMDFLDILLNARDENGEGMTDQEIREEVDTFMFAGHDTTSSAISWCLYNLGRFPEHQQKCFDEVQQLLQGKEKTELEWDDLNSLPFTTMFIKESLRLYAPVPQIARTLVKDTSFPDGTMLPKGTYCIVSPLATHHHPLYWENPEVFDPYRFLPERSKDRHSHAFIPFSAGPRNCIGQNFAMNELKVVVAMTVQRFQIAIDPDKLPEWAARLTLKSLNGIHLKFHTRLT